jgi:hypothetical protein
MIIADTDEKFATLAEAEEEAADMRDLGHRVNGPHKYLDFRGRPYWRLEVEAKNGNGKGRDASDRRARLHRALDVVMDRTMTGDAGSAFNTLKNAAEEYNRIHQTAANAREKEGRYLTQEELHAQPRAEEDLRAKIQAAGLKQTLRDPQGRILRPSQEGFEGRNGHLLISKTPGYPNNVRVTSGPDLKNSRSVSAIQSGIRSRIDR